MRPNTVLPAVLVLIAGLLLAAPAAAQFVIQHSVFGSAASEVEDGTYLLIGTAGQPAGVEGDEAPGVLVGFWYVPELPVEPVHDLRAYALVGLNSLYLEENAAVHSGYVGVLDYGRSGVDLRMDNNAFTAADVDASAPRARVWQNATLSGTLHVAEPPDIGKKAEVANLEQVDADFWPLVRLPEFLTGTPGSRNVDVKKKGSEFLSEGAYGTVRVGQKATLVLTGGTYELQSLEIGQNAVVSVEDEAVLLVAGKLAMDEKAVFGPAAGTQVAAADILVYVHGADDAGEKGGKSAKKGGKSAKKGGKSAKKGGQAAAIGQKATVQANIFAPNGTLVLGQNADATGAFIGRDVVVAQKAEVREANGWTPQRVFPVPATKPVALAKLALSQGQEDEAAFGLNQNYPNPFNPTTTIRYVLPGPTKVSLVVYNVLGQQVRVLVNTLQAPGRYAIDWDGLDAGGRQVASGVYMYRLEARPNVAVRKMVFIK